MADLVLLVPDDFQETPCLLDKVNPRTELAVGVHDLKIRTGNSEPVTGRLQRRP